LYYILHYTVHVRYAWFHYLFNDYDNPNSLQSGPEKKRREFYNHDV